MPNEDFQQHLHPILQELELVRRDQLNRMAFILIALLVAVAVGMLLLIPTFIIVILFLSLPVYLLMFGTRRKRLDVRSGIPAQRSCVSLPIACPNGGL